MENHHFLAGKTHYKWPCSIAMLNYQRVIGGKHPIIHRLSTIPDGAGFCNHLQYVFSIISEYQWIGLRENLQENPIFNGKIYGFL